jgi:uncharacterized protein
MSKTAVITGATSGIGAAFAKHLAADGYNLILTGRKKETIRKLADNLAAKNNVKVDVVIAELSNDADVQRLLDAVKVKDDVEILVNNAGYSGYARHFEEVDMAEHEKMIKVHNTVPLRLIMQVLPGMRKRNSGAIINVCSIGSFLPMQSTSLYVATKAFLKIYTQSLYLELKGTGVKVQALCPGYTESNFAKELYTAEQYKRMVTDHKNLGITADKLVDFSLSKLKKNKWVCIPGFMNNAMIWMATVSPSNMYYSVMTRMTPFK